MNGRGPAAVLRVNKPRPCKFDFQARLKHAHCEAKIGKEGAEATPPMMTNSSELVCDGCGQTATAEHIARRLRRLEWTTRYRPVHIHTLLLGAFSPEAEDEFLYAPSEEFLGEAGVLLDAMGISRDGKGADAVHAEFQKAGFFLTHVLECPLEGQGLTEADIAAALRKRLQAVATRIRRSLKPKRLIAVTKHLSSIMEDILALDLGCPVLMDDGKPFGLESAAGTNGTTRLREAMGVPAG
jgi:hypothetical protein